MAVGQDLRAVGGDERGPRRRRRGGGGAVSFTHLPAHETGLGLVCRLLLEKKKHKAHSKVGTLFSVPYTTMNDQATRGAVRRDTQRDERA